jgi:two-component system sensor histidine kinase VanS
MFSRIALTLIGIFALVVFVRIAFWGSFADGIVQFIVDISGVSHGEALFIYYDVIRNNLIFVLVGVTVIVFIVILRFLMSSFSAYFNEISEGLDILVSDKKQDILLSREMNVMERKLNAIRRTLNKREQDAKEAEQRKNELVTYLAHDIKTPLTSVIGYLSLLDELPEMPEKKRSEYIRITLSKAKRLEGLIEELFEITRYNLQTIVLKKETVDLYYMLAQITDEFYPLLSAKKCEAVLDAPEDLTVEADPDKLARVFNNIIKNALEYGKSGETIEIKARKDGGAVKVTVKNTGTLPKDKLNYIFDKFYRLDYARSSSTGGSGLGLAIAKEIVTAHGGRIYAESEDGFTVFTVVL